MNRTLELRTFLSGLVGQGPRAARLPPDLYRVARSVLRSANLDAVQDLVGDTLLDLLERKGKAGSIDRLLELDDAALARALRKRMVQVRAQQFGSKSRLMKSLRAHVKAALAVDTPSVDSVPLSIMVGDRISFDLVRHCTSFVLSLVDAPAREPRAIAARVWSMFIDGRDEDTRDGAHGSADESHDEPLAAQVDLPGMLDLVREHLGADITRAIGLRASGASLAAIAEDQGVATSTAHGRLAAGTKRLRELAGRRHLDRSDLEPALAALAG